MTLCLLSTYAIDISDLQAQHPYVVKTSAEIEASLKSGEIRTSRAALLYSFIGEYHRSISLTDIPVSWGVDTLDLSSYRTVDALSHILQEAEDHQIVIISENHLRPQHRLFARELLTGLSALGYRHLGMETLASPQNGYELMDKDLHERGYPLDNPLTGTYTMEPAMAHLVREALDLDYRLFAYERREKINGLDRDEIQANHIVTYLHDHPQEKVVILCGFHHVVESSILKRGRNYWMAKLLKDSTGIDPLTIYQDNFTEKVQYDSHPLVHSKNVEAPSVLVDTRGHVVKPTANVDIEVMHPVTHYISGRPQWLYFTDEHQAVNIPSTEIDLNYPVIVSAYFAEEKSGVAADRIELKDPYDRKKLILAPGEYLIKIDDGQQEAELPLTVE